MQQKMQQILNLVLDTSETMIGQSKSQGVGCRAYVENAASR